MRRIWAWMTVGGTLLACGGARREPEAPKPPAPLSPELAAAISSDLVRCDEGFASACQSLGNKLKKARRFDEALAAYDHGCQLGSRGKVDPDGSCFVYAPGAICDPAVCARCSDANRETPECEHWYPDTCANRASACNYDTMANCLDLESARRCVQAARLLYMEMPDVRNDTSLDLDHYCDAEERSWFAQAMGYAQTACDRAEQSPVAKRTGDHEQLCYHLANVQDRMRSCADTQARREESERQVAAMRAQNMALVMQSAQQLAMTANAVSAAKAGYVPVTFTPGIVATPDTPRTFVNPRTGAQWTSPSLARIASVVPGGVQASRAPASPTTSSPKSAADGTARAGDAPSTTPGASSSGTPPGPVASDKTPSSTGGSAPAAANDLGAACGACETTCASLKSSCAKDSMRSCYLAAACLCQCHLSGPNHCGSQPEALNRCISENEGSARKLEGSARAPVAPSDAPPPPKPAPAKPKPTPKPAPARNCPPGVVCADKAI